MIISLNETFQENELIKTQLISNEISYNHSHEYYEFFYIIEGNVQHTCNSTTEIVSANTLYLIRPKMDIHSFKCIPRFNYIKRDITVIPSAFIDVCNFLSPDIFSRILQMPFPFRKRIPTEQITFFENQLSRVIACRDRTEKIMISKALICSMISELFSETETSRDPTLPSWFSELLECFNSVEYLRDGLPAILQTTFYNRAHICKTFKKYMNMTMLEYLTQARLKYACYLLTSTNQPITEICFTLGFVSSSHFNKLFKEKYGITPLKYRKTHDEERREN